MLSVLASWARVEIDGIYYNLDDTNFTAQVTDDGIYTVSSVGYVGDVIVPESVTYNSNVYKVTSIAKFAFNNCIGLTSVVIPNTVTSIGNFAFSDCTNLTSFNIPNSVQNIGIQAFKGCTGLTSITIPTNVTTIDQSIFLDCSSLTSVVWNAKNCTEINQGVHTPFYSVRNQIASFVFGNEVEHIPGALCKGMSNLKEIIIPKSVTSIGNYAFYECTGLTKVNYLGTVDEWAQIYFKNGETPTFYSKDLYINGELLTDLKLSAESIKGNAFYNCKSIKSIEIGVNVTSIGGLAFYGCDSLKSIVWNAKDCPDRILDIIDENSKNITSITFGNEVEHIPAGICFNMSGLKEISIPNSVTSIGDRAFWCCSSLNEITISKDISFIGELAFYECNAISKVNYLGSAEKWVNIDFEDRFANPIYYSNNLYINDKLLIDVKLSSVDTIKNNVFYNCVSIESLELSDDITFIGTDAFRYCTGLKKVNYLGNVDKWASIDFQNHGSAPTDGADFYINNDLLTEVKINKIDSISPYAFYGCKNLRTLEIGEKVRFIGDNAFGFCRGLEEIVWNAKNCSDLSGGENSPFYYTVYYVDSFIFGEQVEYIPAYLCAEMGIYRITIPESVTSIGEYAFSDCKRLYQVTAYPTTVPVAYESSFLEKDGYYDITLYVPCKALEDYSSDEVFGKFNEIMCLPVEDDNESDDDKDAAIIETLSDVNITVTEGTISADTDFTIYNTLGQEVTAQNGSLTPGVYVVKVGDDIAKVMVQ